MKPFKTHRGVVVPLNRANVDTDQIIPKQFLKSIQRTGFGRNLFQDWRYLPDGRNNPDFPLNQERFADASILVTGNNFGCGSSREHAVWALTEYGIRVILAPSKKRDGGVVPAFADIFKNNALKNGILAIEMPSKEIDEIFEAITCYHGLHATVDLEKQTIVFHASKEFSFKFQIDQAIRERLLKGLDDIGLTLQKEEAIGEYERQHNPSPGAR